MHDCPYCGGTGKVDVERDLDSAMVPDYPICRNAGA